MDILSIAEENFLISLSIVLMVGLIQGLILGRGIRKKPNPVLRPNILNKNDKPSSGVVGTVSSDNENFSGIANLMMFTIVLIVNNDKSIIDTNLA